MQGTQRLSAVSAAFVIAISVLSMTLMPNSAQATWVPGDGATIVRIDANDGQRSGHLQWVFTPQHQLDGTWKWGLPAGQENRAIRAGNDVLATVSDILLEIQTDPAVSLGFVVTAGPVDTTFTITSATLPFAAITNPLAFATAAITVTDENSNGATATGAFPGDKAYRASYNNPAQTWADLVAPVTALQDSSNTGSERKPLAGRETILASVYQIQSEFRFTLTAEDSASGTSKFDVIVPEPLTSSLMLVGALGLLRRRR